MDIVFCPILYRLALWCFTGCAPTKFRVSSVADIYVMYVTSSTPVVRRNIMVHTNHRRLWVRMGIV
jgi:hypothetical protein